MKVSLQKAQNLYSKIFEKYEWALSNLLRIDRVQVRKEKFVRKAIAKCHADDVEGMCDMALQTSLAEVLAEEQRDKVYHSITRRHAFFVFVVSFITTFPESIMGIVVACTIDFILFQIALYHAMQQIMMLYGKECDLNENEDKGVETIISIESSGLMMGKYPIIQKMKSVVGWLLRQLVKKIGPKLTSKAARAIIPVLRRQSIKWVSVIVAKKNVDAVMEALIPITCAAISGFVSVAIFVPMCNKLRKHLLTQTEEYIR